MAPNQPPKRLSFGNRKNNPNNTGLAGHNKAKKVIGRVNIPMRQQAKMTVAIIKKA
ncbi:hypothetical protein [Acinetobacter sp. ANC 4173]|uniref:hypothetical protein n=1 Tax=Acinetobacter sp. ANC 4173 TaxID=2529837 RepID=UPI001D0DA89F|nr:hypothetical protein [Acinetobacter sp. ANC 4173]